MKIKTKDLASAIGSASKFAAEAPYGPAAKKIKFEKLHSVLIVEATSYIESIRIELDVILESFESDNWSLLVDSDKLSKFMQSFNNESVNILKREKDISFSDEEINLHLPHILLDRSESYLKSSESIIVESFWMTKKDLIRFCTSIASMASDDEFKTELRNIHLIPGNSHEEGGNEINVYATDTVSLISVLAKANWHLSTNLAIPVPFLLKSADYIAAKDLSGYEIDDSKAVDTPYVRISEGDDKLCVELTATNTTFSIRLGDTTIESNNLSGNKPPNFAGVIESVVKKLPESGFLSMNVKKLRDFVTSFQRAGINSISIYVSDGITYQQSEEASVILRGYNQETGNQLEINTNPEDFIVDKYCNVGLNTKNFKKLLDNICRVYDGFITMNIYNHNPDSPSYEAVFVEHSLEDANERRRVTYLIMPISM